MSKNRIISGEKAKILEQQNILKTIETAARQPTIPMFCGTCRAALTWERYPEGDRKSDSGVVLWEKWKCGKCGATTIYPVKANF